jgi:hypothetical protein
MPDTEKSRGLNDLGPKGTVDYEQDLIQENQEVQHPLGETSGDIEDDEILPKSEEDDIPHTMEDIIIPNEIKMTDIGEEERKNHEIELNIGQTAMEESSILEAVSLPGIKPAKDKATENIVLDQTISLAIESCGSGHEIIPSHETPTSEQSQQPDDAAQAEHEPAITVRNMRSKLQSLIGDLKTVMLSRQDVYELEDLFMDAKRQLFEAERRGRTT